MMFKFLLRPVRLIFAAILVLTLPGWKAAAVPHTFASELSTSLPALAQAPISALIGADQSIYHARLSGTHFLMDNAEQGLSAEFSADGMQVSAGVHSWGLTLEGYGYGESLQPLPAVDPTRRDNRLEYARGPLTEWYLNGPFGLEQGFTLDRPPAGKSTGGPLTLSLTLGGDLRAAVDTSGQGLVLSDPGGAEVLRYAGLSAYDAAGLDLPARLELRGKALLLQVNDAGARYPLTIDPFVQKAKLTASDKGVIEYFGWSVSISGDVVVVGAFRARPDGTNNAGAAYVFVKPVGGWADMTQVARLTASDKAASDEFGNSVSISGDVVVVGAWLANPGGTTDAGAAYVFVKPGGSWADMTQTAKLTASDKAAGDYFGRSVSISSDVVVVGAQSADPGGTVDAGAAYVFVKPGGGWSDMTQTAKLIASDKAVSDQFGISVSNSGDVVVVGAICPNNAGAAYVFVKPGGGWVDMTQTAKLTASDKAVGDYFGVSVSISGDVVVVGAQGADPGGTVEAGAAYVFVKPGGGWADMIQTAKLTASDKAAGDAFGYSVSISGDVVVVGAEMADPDGTSTAGATYVFAKPGGVWADMTQTAKLTSSDKAVEDLFGFSVSISGDVVVVGASHADPGGTVNAGASYVFVDWYSTTTTITSDSPDPSLAGGTVNVSVTVSGGSTTPSGTVDITGADTNCSISLSSGSGNCDVTFDTVGAKTLTATYTGDTTHAGSSDTEDHAVIANTTTTITSDAPDPSTDGQDVTVNFTVTVNPPGSGTPTGDVTVSDGVDSCSASVAAGSCTLALNTEGTRSLTASYPGDTDFNGSSDTEDHTVKDNTTTTITSDSPDPSLAGGTVNVSVTVSGGSTTPSGTVDITGADANCSISLSGGSGNCNVTFNTVGAKTLTATYNGDATHAGSSDTEEHTVKANTITTITSDTPDPSTDGQDVTVNFTVTVNPPGSGTPTGDVTVSDGVDSCSASVAAGSCTLALNTEGTRSLTASYPGDTDFNGSSDTKDHTVKDNTTTTITSDSPDPSLVGGTVNVNVTVSGGTTPSGTVDITGADMNCSISLSGGGGNCNVTFDTVGAKTLTATYNGDATHAGSSDTEDHAVKVNTTTTITSDSPDPSLVGETVNVSVTVSGGSTTPTGTVDITGADTNCSISLSGGSGNCNVTFDTVGAKTLTATYTGDTTHAGSSDTEAHIVKDNTITTITSDTPDPSTDGQNVTVNFTVTVNSPGSGTPTGTVTVSDGVDSCSASVAVGSCTLALNTVGTRSLTATYPGDTDFNGSSDTESHEVKAHTTTTITSDSPDPSLVGGTVNVSVTVSGGSTTPSGTVDISGADTNCSITLSGGIGNCDVTFDTVGAKTLTATYTGDTTHAGSSDTEDHAVKANTTTTITSDAPDPSTDGQNVTVNFTVTVNPPGSGTPTGDVTVSDGVDSCSASVAAGSCVLVLNTLGTRSLTATYPGDTDFNGSSDTEGHQVIPRTSNFYSAGTNDGWILESSETISLGGSINASDTTFRLGDDASDRQYRSILSFNTASLPDTAVITSIVLKIKKQGLVGTDPFTTHLGLLVDIRKPYFGTALGLAASDFQATAGKSSVGTFGTTPSAGWYSVTLSSTARPYINKTGTTQFRLRFEKGDNDDMGADYLKFFSGNYTTSTSRPLLIIQYYVP